MKIVVVRQQSVSEYWPTPHTRHPRLEESIAVPFTLHSLPVVDSPNTAIPHTVTLQPSHHTLPGHSAKMECLS
ncbi:hypothetical protein E2C01_012616 [Portunus trituberculatus]|uniref:Uncharacterized protein n=1 Tax=Portunus trituberculatus TaxID=210409 RepID=A0A5B7DEP3_PORTR|nr:hypothetical protein [Portunus trituberculatus]